MDICYRMHILEFVAARPEPDTEISRLRLPLPVANLVAAVRCMMNDTIMMD